MVPAVRSVQRWQVAGALACVLVLAGGWRVLMRAYEAVEEANRG